MWLRLGIGEPQKEAHVYPKRYDIRTDCLAEFVCWHRAVLHSVEDVVVLVDEALDV